jgi:C_GCAxxG_C_C family probable redox protein
MKKMEPMNLSRRSFLTSASTLLVGSQLLGRNLLFSATLQSTQHLGEELSEEEWDWVKKSSMAGDIKNYAGKGYSCAESLWMVSLRHLKKPEELVWIASGFGGGLFHRDLCGYLTGGIMALGLRSGMLDKERKEAKEHCKRLVKEYWKWWNTQAPLHCSEIKEEGTSSKVCMRLGLLAAAKTEELLSIKA